MFPGLESLKEEDVPKAFEKQVDLKAPLSVGIAWVNETGGYWGESLSEYQRTGVLDAIAAELKTGPIKAVSPLPTTTEMPGKGERGRSLDGIRSAAAKFQQDVVILLQTGTADGSGLNPLAISYIALVTILIVPGNDVAEASSAEMCAMDVRSGVMLGCARGRASREAQFLLAWSASEKRQAIQEETVKEAAVDAAKSLLVPIALRTKE